MDIHAKLSSFSISDPRFTIFLKCKDNLKFKAGNFTLFMVWQAVFFVVVTTKYQRNFIFKSLIMFDLKVKVVFKMTE